MTRFTDAVCMYCTRCTLTAAAAAARPRQVQFELLFGAIFLRGLSQLKPRHDAYLEGAVPGEGGSGGGTMSTTAAAAAVANTTSGGGAAGGASSSRHGSMPASSSSAINSSGGGGGTTSSSGGIEVRAYRDPELEVRVSRVL